MKRNSKRDGEVVNAKMPTSRLEKVADLRAVLAPSKVPHNVESDALGFFFIRYCLHSDSQATCGFFDILPAMYAKSSLSSPLTKATIALALQVADLHSYRVGGRDLAYSVYTEAVTRTRESIADAAQSRSDELLMTTLVLGMYESVSSTFGRGGRPAAGPHTHVLGSVALLKHRRTQNYRDQLSWRLLIATRSRLL